MSLPVGEITGSRVLQCFSFEELVHELTATHARLLTRLELLEAQNHALSKRTEDLSSGSDLVCDGKRRVKFDHARVEELVGGLPEDAQNKQSCTTFEQSQSNVNGLSDLETTSVFGAWEQCASETQNLDVTVGVVRPARSKPSFPSEEQDHEPPVPDAASASLESDSGSWVVNLDLQEDTDDAEGDLVAKSPGLCRGNEDVEDESESTQKRRPRRKEVITGEETKSKSWFGKFALRPDSLKRLSWDVITVLVVCYDCIVFPIDFVFSSFDGGKTVAVDTCITIFWTLDLPVCFLTGFHTAGLVEMRLKAIARNYIRKWFVLDLFMVLLDWAFVAVSLREGFGVLQLVRMAKAARLSRVLRAVRVIRFAKFYRVVSELFVQIKSEQMRAVFNIAVMILGLVFANHYIACGWYYLGSEVTVDGGLTWLTITHMEHRDNVFKYTTALHWSLTQFTPASMDVSATNVAERVYSICVLLFALVTFTSFVSSITTSMTHLRKMRSEPERQESLLREYFFVNNLTAELGQRVWKHLWANHFSIKKRLHEQDVAILALVPDFLRWKIREELHLPVITRLPFLSQYAVKNATGVQELCHRAMEERSLIANDDLFVKDTVATKTFFVTGGFLQYNHHVRIFECQVKVKEWTCEPALWLKWSHVGTMTAKTTVEINALDVAVFWKTMMKHARGFDFLLSYKKTFNDYMAAGSYSDMASLPQAREKRHSSFGRTWTSYLD